LSRRGSPGWPSEGWQRKASGLVVPAVTMDPAFLSGGVTLSTDKLSVTRPNSAAWTLARGARAITSGGFYFETRVDSFGTGGGGGDVVLGIIDSTLAATDGPVGDTTHSGGVIWIGGTYYNGSAIGFGWTSPVPVGDWVGILYILGSKNLHGYYPPVGGSGWDSGSGDVATDFGGRNLAGVGGTVYPAWSMLKANAQATFNFGATTFAYPAAASACLAAGYPAYKDA
jgi:hypothetical protein